MKRVTVSVCSLAMMFAVTSAALADIEIGPIGESTESSTGSGNGEGGGGNAVAAFYIGLIPFCIFTRGPALAQEKWIRTGKKPTFDEDFTAVAGCLEPVSGLVDTYARGVRLQKWMRARGVSVGDGVTTNDIIKKSMGAP
ncbi:hypothetical protein HY413_03215 [Candidatus Kaiserbacteria bacterium]|nr:hypothetical protein [Candidatus Kaiserbacteria bacterium]